MKKTSLKLLFILKFILITYSNASESSTENHDQVMTVAEFEQAIKNDPVLQSLNENGPLNEDEKETINEAKKYENISFGGKYGRLLSSFKGDTLLVGGGKLGGENNHNDGVSNIKKYVDMVENYKSGLFLYNVDTGKKIETIDQREAAIKPYQEAIDKIQNQYFTINIDKLTEPDMLASITSINDMSSIPNGRFKKIIFENVNCIVFLNPKLWPIIERITAPGGEIFISSGMHCRRLIPLVTKYTKWKNDIYAQTKKDDKTGAVEYRLKN